MLRTIAAAACGLLLSVGAALSQTCTLPLTLPNTLTNGTNTDATQVMANFNALLNCINNPPAAAQAVAGQGRLTLVTLTPVMASSQSGKNTIYYTPYVGNQVALYNGTAFNNTSFAELTNITSNSSVGNAGPAAVAANSNYDLFVWSNSGTVTLTRGPAWTSDTGRGTGAGTTELQRINGIWTNKNAITNGPGANRGTYVGTVRSDGSSLINFVLGGVSTGGTAAILGVWNTYNRVAVKGFIGDNTASWTYTTATVRAANGTNAMRVSYVQGLQEDFLETTYTVTATNSTGPVAQNAGVCSDTTSSFAGRVGYVVGTTATAYVPLTGSYAAQGLGFHYTQACEYSVASGTSTWYGVGAAGIGQNGLTYGGMF